MTVTHTNIKKLLHIHFISEINCLKISNLPTLTFMKCRVHVKSFPRTGGDVL